jgi:hypothetical protein
MHADGSPSWCVFDLRQADEEWSARQEQLAAAAAEAERAWAAAEAAAEAETRLRADPKGCRHRGTSRQAELLATPIDPIETPNAF